MIARHRRLLVITGIAGAWAVLSAPGMGSDRYVLESESYEVLPATIDLPPIVEIMGPASVSAQTLAAPPLDVSAESLAAPPQAVRLETPTTTTVTVPATVYTGNPCDLYRGLVASYPGWSVDKMMGIMYRESRCDTFAYNAKTHDRGLLQIHWQNSYYTEIVGGKVQVPLMQACGFSVLDELFIPEVNIRCAHVLYSVYGYSPWSATS